MRKDFPWLVGVLLLVAVASALAGWRPPSARKDAGFAIDGVRLGMTKAEVLRTLGRPFDHDAAYHAPFYVHWTYRDQTDVFFCRGRVSKILGLVGPGFTLNGKPFMKAPAPASRIVARLGPPCQQYAGELFYRQGTTMIYFGRACFAREIAFVGLADRSPGMSPPPPDPAGEP